MELSGLVAKKDVSVCGTDHQSGGVLLGPSVTGVVGRNALVMRRQLRVELLEALAVLRQLEIEIGVGACHDADILSRNILHGHDK